MIERIIHLRGDFHRIVREGDSTTIATYLYFLGPITLNQDIDRDFLFLLIIIITVYIHSLLMLL